MIVNVMIEIIAQLAHEARSRRLVAPEEFPQDKGKPERKGFTIYCIGISTKLHCRLQNFFRLNWQREIFLMRVVGTQLSPKCGVTFGKEIVRLQ